MPFDVRAPIGLLFLAIGLLVGGYGLAVDPAAPGAAADSVNIDLVWGSVMAVFGALMLALVAVTRRKGPPEG